LQNSYIESVWYLLKNLWDRGLIYQGYKVVPYDPRIGATLSSHEVAQNYREVADPSLFVRFRATGETQTFFLVWTTTPWTLPSNLLLAVHPNIEYVWARRGEETLILARELLSVLKDENYTIVRSAMGRDLEGARSRLQVEFQELTGPVQCFIRDMTGRPEKSTSSIADKLRRESLRLRQMQDIAGCRVIVGDVLVQDESVLCLSRSFANASVVDRRKIPSHG
jgi:tRNA synthetases class I (I, L, M and V)